MPTTNAVSGVVPDLPMHESFENSIGPFTENWGVDFSTFGEARFFGNQYSTAGMKEPGADPSIGHGYGTYTVNAMLTGNTWGPAIMLWPGDNKYPGAEIDLAELKPDGSGHQYATVHWSDNGQNGQQQYYFDDVRSGVFHDYQAIWEPGKITLSVDGHVAAVVTEHVPVDYNHGGMNEVFAFLNINDATSLVVRDVSFVPLGGTATAAAPAAAAVATPASAASDPSVYRFYDTERGGHFFTSSIAERDSVVSQLPAYSYEGVGFKALDPGPAGAAPVFRFYNAMEGGHFFTISTVERDTVMATNSAYRYEGVGFYEANAAGAGLTPVYRYYDPSNGGHFFTADAAEKASVDAHSPNYHFEGIAFYAPPGGGDPVFHL